MRDGGIKGLVVAAACLNLISFAVAASIILRLFDLPYTGLTQGALLFAPGLLYGLAFLGLMILLFIPAFLSFKLSGGEINPLTVELTAGFLFAVFILFGLARLNYVAVYPDRISFRDGATYKIDEIDAIKLGCVASRGSKSAHNLIFEVRIDYDQADLAKSDYRSWVSDFMNNHEKALEAAEHVVLKLRSRDVTVIRSQIDPDCIRYFSNRLSDKGNERLRTVGWID